MPDIPEVLNNELAIESVENIDDRLREQASEVNRLVISDQELRELRGVFNPAGDAETKIDSLDKMANSYRLKALRETDERKENIYKIVSETAELKLDFIRLTETNDEPRYLESQNIIRETVDENKSIKDLSRLERLKNWVKENIVSVSALAISVAGIVTIIIVGSRNAIKKGAKTTGKLAKAVYYLGKRLSPWLIPIFNMLATVLSWGDKGLSWLASNFWVLALALAWFVYDQYKQQRK